VDAANTIAEESGASSEGRPVLEFLSARIPLDGAGMQSPPIDLVLTAGSLALIEADDGQQAALLADAAVGLTPPRQGRIRFLDRDWSEVPPLHVQAMRGRIGHVFATGSWIDGLGLLDNILLPQLYHTRRPIAALRDEAALLATMFGLPGVPIGDPGDFSPGDLQRAACVRAFLGRPKLIILEHPTQGVFPSILEPLVNAVRAARDRDAAVLWLTLDRAVCTDPSMPADARHRFRNGALQTLARAA
jgi:phospholipid/cholesterol/gamma-HCH transport system ATP-binding protein